MISIEEAKDKIDFLVEYSITTLEFNMEGNKHDIIDGFDHLTSLCNNRYFHIRIYYCPDYNVVDPIYKRLKYYENEENYLIIVSPPDTDIREIFATIVTEKNAISKIDNILTQFYFFTRLYRNIKINKLLEL